MASLLESFLFFLLYAFIYLTYFYYTFIIHTRKHRLEIVYETKIIVIETAKWKLEFLDLSNSYIRSIYSSHKFDDISFESCEKDLRFYWIYHIAYYSWLSKEIHHFSTPKILSFRVQVRSISSYSWFSLSILKKKEE